LNRPDKKLFRGPLQYHAVLYGGRISHLKNNFTPVYRFADCLRPQNRKEKEDILMYKTNQRFDNRTGRSRHHVGRFGFASVRPRISVRYGKANSRWRSAQNFA